mmetsp:Transcript_3474/g.10242  ORF Transcript_3474/g.10242 Transcript_3474/m.10242 type:complete len:392 (+) Transcript_3474:277-1452(+)
MSDTAPDATCDVGALVAADAAAPGVAANTGALVADDAATNAAAIDAATRAAAPPDVAAKPSYLTPRQRGVAIACLGVVCVTPDAVLLRWLQHLGASTAAILFWKLIFVFACTLAWVLARAEKPLLSGLAARVATGPRHFWSIVAIQGFVDLTFSLGLLLNTPARVLVFYSLNLLWSALLGYAFLDDLLPRRTVFACFFACCCVLLIFVPQLAGEPAHASALGDACSVLAGVGIALFLLVARDGARTCPRVPVELGTALGALFAALAVVASTAQTGASVGHVGGRWEVFLPVALLDGLCIAAIFVCMSIAPKYITGAEIGLCSLLETILGPLWVFLVFDERPPTFTLVGGALLVGSLAAHEYVSARAAQAQKTVARRPSAARFKSLRYVRAS